MFGLQNYEENPVGELNGKLNYHYLHRLNNIDLFNKHHKSHNRASDAIPAEFKRLNKKQYNSVTNMLNNLQNFNATSKGLTQFEHHDTHKHMFKVNDSHKRYLLVNNRNTDIQDKIDKMRKSGKHYERYPEHSSFLTPSKGR